MQNDDFDEVLEDHDHDDIHSQAVKLSAQNRRTCTRHHGHDENHSFAIMPGYNHDENHGLAMIPTILDYIEDYDCDQNHGPAMIATMQYLYHLPPLISRPASMMSIDSRFYP